MNKCKTYLFSILIAINCISCQFNESSSQQHKDAVEAVSDTLNQGQIKDEKATPKEITSDDISIHKELLFDKYILEDTYPYKDTVRYFQWNKIKEHLALLENTQRKTPIQWGILQNYKNRNGEAPLVRKYQRDAYRRIADTLGVERYQAVPLFLLNDTLTPERYGQDGELVKVLTNDGNFIKVAPIFVGDEWLVPKKYIKFISDTIVFNKAIMVDRKNQNIATLERISKGSWTVRSMNPATTGRHLPPYAQETPLGIFVLQEKKARMVFLKDGSQETGGFAPFASRFSDGGYIHGIPVNEPQKTLIEYSPSLGTTPRSHMCVRNATSHAKFIFEWAPVNETIVFVLE